MPQPTIRIGVVTISDRASAGTYEDASGPAIVDYLTEVLESPFACSPRLIPDVEETIRETLIALCDEGCVLVLTTGGTGPAPRDVTPEATAAVCEKMLPGFGEEMRRASLAFVPTAILSRQTAGIRGETLIINLPGKPKAIAECLDAVFAAIPYAIELIGGPVVSTNTRRFTAFRPKPRT